MPLIGRSDRKGAQEHNPQRPGETIYIDRRYSLKKGRGHIIEEHQGSLCYEILRSLLSKRDADNAVQGFIVSRQHPTALREKYGLEGVPMLWLATQPGENTIDPTSLGMLAHAVAEFLSKTKDGLVLLDGIEYLMTNNDFKKVARLIEQINDSVMNYHGYLLMTMDPRTFDPKELAILERNFEIIHPKGSPGNSG